MNATIREARPVAFQGEPGAYANLAAREALPHAMAPEDKPVRQALEELQFFFSEMTVLGVYPAYPLRKKMP